MKYRVLLACEESQVVCKAFRFLGHDAYSCDLLSCSGGKPEWHIQDDVLKHLDDGWDMMIAFPPCTHIAVSGAWLFKRKRADGSQQRAVDFFMSLVNAPIDKIAVENPVSIMSTVYRKPDQIIQPWQYGHGETKRTCLWLKNLPLLKSTNIVEGRKQRIWKMSPSPERSRLRGLTYSGIALAMACQWGGSVYSNKLIL